jgi:glycosyltransferase involved in cell wall biosynthesis
VHLLMVGDGELRDECRRFSLEHDLPVTYAGFLNQSEIVKGYVAADCLVLASDSGETWGLVVNEAMICGLPALLSRSCGCAPDLIIEGETGSSFPCGAVELLADCMLRLVFDRELLRQMGEGAQRHIGSFTTNRAADRLLEAMG